MRLLWGTSPSQKLGTIEQPHARHISSAAVITDACNIEKEIISLTISQAPRGA